MIIYYKNYGKNPDCGDLKILKNGKMFFRTQLIISGLGYIVSNGRPVYEWYDVNDERVNRHLENFNREGYSIFRSTSKTKVTKTKVLKFDFTKENDRKRYTKLTGISVESDTTIANAKLEVEIQ